MKKILIISYSNLTKDPRLNRQFVSFKNKYKIYAAGYHCPKSDSISFIELNHKRSILERIKKGLKLILKKYTNIYFEKEKYKKICSELDLNEIDIIYANDVNTLPLAQILQNECKAKLVFDAHEYSPLEFEGKWLWRLLFMKFYTYLLRTYVFNVDVMITVCDSIAEKYQDVFGIKKVHVIKNAAIEEINLKPSKTSDKVIELVHHGYANRSRKLEKMIELMSYLEDRFVLNFFLMGTDYKYINYLKKISKGKKINFLQPIKMQEISKKINKYDIGLYILENTSFNNFHALPNKLFEFIQARLAIAIGPSIEMKKILETNNLGVCSESFDPQLLAKKMNLLTASQIDEFKKNSHQTSKILNAENEGKKLCELLESL